jgi:hypothetical protein
MRRSFIASFCLVATLVTNSLTSWAASGPATPTPPPHAYTRGVITDINGQVSAASNRWQRLVVMGLDDNARPADTTNSTYAVIDTARARLIARQRTDGSIQIATVDDQRALLYMIVQTLPVRVTGQGTSYHYDLWTIDLRSGRLRWHKLLFEGELVTVIGMTVDPPTGHLFLATIRPGSATYELTMVEPDTMKSQIQSLDGVPDHVFSDVPHRRVVVSEQAGVAGGLVSNLVAFDARDERHIWTHHFEYVASTYAAFDVKYDPAALEAWILAPGGLVTELNIGTGRVTRNIRMGYQRTTDWAQYGFDVSYRTAQTFDAWVGQGKCNIDRTDRRSARRVFINYPATTACNQPTSTLLTVAQDRDWIVTADTYLMRVFDGGSGRLIKSYDLTFNDVNGTPTGSTWTTSANVQVNGHTWVALIGEVHHQNDATGALMTGAAVLFPIS